jgi:hypothetical protein
MKPSRHSPRRPTWLVQTAWFAVIGLSLGLAGCRDAKIAAYRIPKEMDPPASSAAAPAPASRPANGGFAVASNEMGELAWTAPADWRSKPGTAMRKGSYAVGDEGAAGAELAITAFPGDVGGDLANVNRWRGQLGLPAIADAELGAAFIDVTAHGLTLKVVDLTGGTQRMLGAIVPYAGATWFFKLTGAEAAVARARPAYFEFLQTIQAPAAASAPAASIAAAPVSTGPDITAAPVAEVGGPALKWTAPVHWQSRPATALRKATFVMTGASGATGELAVTAFPGDVGGELANVNRWRGQLGLPPVAAAELPDAVMRVTTNGLPVVLVDFTGGPAGSPTRLLGAIVPQGGATWFFKLTGPESLVAVEKPAFLTFIQSLSAP